MGHIDRLVLIGTSAGGVKALQTLFQNLRRDYTVPTIVIQHLPSGTPVRLHSVYARSLPGSAYEIEDKMPLEPGKFYFAPAGYHALLEADGTLALSQDDMVNHSRPSIDVTFESAALAFGAHVIGVLLTGANEDGARGLREIHEHGGLTYVQDPGEAEVRSMPEAALKLFRPTLVAGLAEIATLLSQADRGGEH